MSEDAMSLPRRPLLLTLGMAWSLLLAVVAGLTALSRLAIAVWRNPSAGFAEGLHEGIFLALILCVGLGVLGWALWANKPWTRLAIMGFWSVGLVMAVTELALGKVERPAGCSSVISILLAAGIAALYMFRKATVVAYYSALKTRNEPRPGAA